MKYFSIVLLFMGLLIFAGTVQAQGNKPFKINTTTTSGGMMTPRVANLKQGETKQFTLHPEDSYRVVGVFGCDGAYDASTLTYTTAPASADCEIHASFHSGTNQVPVVSVDEDMTVEIGSTVILSGTATDTDGSIDSTSWQQISGTTTTSSQTADTITFFAGEVTGDAPLVFVFTATDNEGALVSDSVQITVIDSTPASLPLVFSDEFDDAVDDLTKWNFGNTPHQESNGSLSLKVIETDRGRDGATTNNFPSLTKTKLEMRHFMSPGGFHFFPAVSLRLANGNEFSLTFLRSTFLENNCNKPSNQDRVLLATVPWGGLCLAESNLISSQYYNTWIVSVVEFDSVTGDFTLDIGDDDIVDFEATVASEYMSPVTNLNFSTYGWFTGHSHLFDYIRVYGE